MQGEKNAHVRVSWSSGDGGVCRGRGIYNDEKNEMR
jgi:hypothetical protein